MKRVMIIGMVEGNHDDKFTLTFIMGQLASSGRKDLFHLLADAVRDETADIYDMQSHPERGDAMDHLGDDLGLVIAMHLYGIDKMPRKGPPLHEQLATIPDVAGDAIKAYSRDNFYLLERCMELRVSNSRAGTQVGRHASRQVRRKAGNRRSRPYEFFGCGSKI